MLHQYFDVIAAVSHIESYYGVLCLLGSASIYGQSSQWCVHITQVMDLTHFSQQTSKRVIGKQFRPRSDTAELLGSTLFALNTGISIKHSNNKN